MNPAKRIVSFLPSATEIACALGLQNFLVGITHECDYPPEAQGKPIVVRNALPIERMSQSEIDAAVEQRIKEGLSLYQIDEELLRKLAPDLILTQNLCQVCAPSGNEVSQVLKLLPQEPDVLWLTPRTLNEIQQNILELGAATDRQLEAEALGMPRALTFRRIILPQAIRTILPPMTSDFVALFKDTSIVSIIALCATFLFLKTQLGYSIAVYGNNPAFFQFYGISTGFVVACGLAHPLLIIRESFTV